MESKQRRSGDLAGKRISAVHPTRSDAPAIRSTLVGGCLSIMVSILVSCGLLVLNGALVMAVLTAMVAAGADWLRRESVSQFLLFAIPVALLIVQWMMLDTLRNVLRRRKKPATRLSNK